MKSEPRLVDDKWYTMRSGDVIAAPSVSRGRNEPTIILVSIPDKHLAVFRVGTGGWAVSSPFNHQPSPGLYEVGDAGMQISTTSRDAGYIVDLSLAP
jgi:hypothetical protein